MNHLTTDQERQERWYSKSIWPRYIPVIPCSNVKELLQPAPDIYSQVSSLPMELLTALSPASHTPQSPSSEQGCTTNLLQTILENHGFVIISNVLSTTECQEALSLAWDYLEAASLAEQYQQQQHTPNLSTNPPLQRNDPSTYATPFLPKHVEGGIYPYYGSGHSTFAWNVRSHPNVRAIFESLHQTDRLLSSLDGLIVWRTQQAPTDAGWFHVDQNPRYKPTPCSVQGLVNLLPVTEATGGNVLVAHSHCLFPAHYCEPTLPHLFYKERLDEVGTDDWLEIDPNDDKVLQPQHVLSCLLQPGDVLLWDSRMVHCSYPGRCNNDNDGAMLSSSTSTLPSRRRDGLERAGVLVSMMPADRASASVIQQRIEAVHASRTLTHWANQVAPLGEERSEFVAFESNSVRTIKQWQKQPCGSKVLLEFDDLTNEQRRLVLGELG